MGDNASDNVFLCIHPSHTEEEFREFAKAAERFKPFGRVMVDVAHLADKTWSDIPEGGSPWHEYTAYKAPLHKFFPPDTLTPHMPMDWVKKNRKLLESKAKVLENLGLDGYYKGQDPFFLPDSFFREYPELRGARVDHPGRSTQDAFTWCVDRPEVLDMMAEMVKKLKQTVPQLTTYVFTQNDAGSGLCWSDYLYPGINGPRYCQMRNHGQRMRDFLESIHRGAKEGGGDIEVHMHGNLSRQEYDMLEPITPENTHISAKYGRSSKTCSHIGVTGLIGYPVLGMCNPLAIFRSLARAQSGGPHIITFGFSGSYGRGPEGINFINKQIDIAVEFLKDPAEGRLPILTKLRDFCEQWGGKDKADDLFDAFWTLDEAFKQKQLVAGSFTGEYEAVSTRHLTRPPVLLPEELTPEEEDYFLPHVFNPDTEKARLDYTDVHGSRVQALWGGGNWYWLIGLQNVFSMVRSAAQTFENVAQDAPEGEWLSQMGRSCRMWVSMMRSINNVFFAQVFRDENKGVLKGEGGSLVNLNQWREIYQDELENTQEMIGFLADGGLEYMAVAPDAEHEDTFVLGPDILDQLKKKLDIMYKHEKDINRFV